MKSLFSGGFFLFFVSAYAFCFVAAATPRYSGQVVLSQIAQAQPDDKTLLRTASNPSFSPCVSIPETCTAVCVWHSFLDNMNGAHVSDNVIDQIIQRSQAVKAYAIDLEHKVEEKYKDLPDWNKFQAYIDAFLAAMNRLWRAFEGVDGLEDLRKELEEALRLILEEMQREFPPTQDAPGHEQRKTMIHTALSRAEVSVVALSVNYGMDEDEVREKFESVSFYLEELAVITGDFGQQHPELLGTLAFVAVAMIVPEGWFARLLLSFAGFGPLGPTKGSLAAWMQSRFFGAIIPAGSWFSHLQRAAMAKWRSALPGILGLVAGAWAGVKIMWGW
ncbi:hypothetical protein EIP91_003724 [Steccherinum ochraceum]|uniref:Uncharacterized protein n=1 Tax=Steccherinum ochraceum TaxID=92696 RepID=A0A4R0RT24_9APHY|nr:hypothetical protein EIP91_003724 [Steccherinum ochraceum]